MKETRTYADRRGYIIKDVAKRRRKIRLMAIQYAGEKCFKCGYSKCLDVLEFHHRDPSKKSFGIGQNRLTRSWESVKAEIEKCDLLCANCHRELHAEQNKLQKA